MASATSESIRSRLTAARSLDQFLLSKFVTLHLDEFWDLEDEYEAKHGRDDPKQDKFMLEHYSTLFPDEFKQLRDEYQQSSPPPSSPPTDYQYQGPGSPYWYQHH